MCGFCVAYILALVLAAGPPQQNVAPGLPAQGMVSQPASNQTASLQGTVVNAQTGEPVRKAQVMIVSQPEASGIGNREPIIVSTDLSGHFSASGLEPGKYHLRAEANRFVPQGYGERRPGGFGKQLILGSGQNADGLTFRLEPSGAITGTVRDEDGDAVQGARVQAIPVGRNFGFHEGGQERTNDLGEYRLYNLMPGQYLVQVSSESGRERDANSHQTYVPMFYPGTAALDEAIPVSVQPGGESQGIDVDLRPVHAVRVRGRLVNLATGQAESGYVMLLPRDIDATTRKGAIRLLSASRSGTGVRDPQGDFEIDGVPAGSYWLYGQVQESEQRYQGRVAVEVGDTDVQGIQVPVSAGVTVTGHVRVEPDQAFDFSKIVISLNSPEGFMGGQTALAKSDGTFVLEGVPSGNYRLNVSGFPEQYYVKSARFGGGDALESGLMVDSGGATGLDIVLSSSGGSVSGTVLKDHQPAQATVVLVPDPPRRDREDLYSSKPTKQDGTFTLVGLPPGDFKLFAFEDPDPDLESDPSLLQPYETKGQSVHIEDGQSQSVQLELIPTDSQP